MLKRCRKNISFATTYWSWKLLFGLSIHNKKLWVIVQFSNCNFLIYFDNTSMPLSLSPCTCGSALYPSVFYKLITNEECTVRRFSCAFFCTLLDFCFSTCVHLSIQSLEAKTPIHVIKNLILFSNCHFRQVHFQDCHIRSCSEACQPFL